MLVPRSLRLSWLAICGVFTLHTGKVRSLNRRTLDALGSKVFFYYSHVHELAGKLADIRPTLISLHRTACLHHDDIGQATVRELCVVETSCLSCTDGPCCWARWTDCRLA